MQNALSFNSIQIPVVSKEDGSQWVSVTHVCQALDVSPAAQREKIKNGVEFSWSDIESTGADGKHYTMFCVAASHAHLWVASIQAARVREDIRDQFIAYKHECANVIYNHFTAKGEDFLGIAQQLAQINNKLDHLVGATDAVFGDDKVEIQSLVERVAQEYKVDGRTVWGWVQTECDVGSYKKQNMKVKNFLLNKLGKGIRVVK